MGREREQERGGEDSYGEHQGKTKNVKKRKHTYQEVYQRSIFWSILLREMLLLNSYLVEFCYLK